MSEMSRRDILIGLHWLMMALLLSCCDPVEPTPVGSVGNAQGQSNAEGGVHEQRLRKFAAWLPQRMEIRIETDLLADEVAKYQANLAEKEKAQALYAQAKARGEKVKPLARTSISTPPLLEALFPPLRHDLLIAELYPAESPRLRFISPEGGLTPSGQTVLDAVSKADDHALDPALFGYDRIMAALSRYKQLSELDDTITLNPRETAALARMLQEKGLELGYAHITAADFASIPEDEIFEALFLALIELDTSPIPRIAAAYRTWLERKKYLSAYRTRLEYAIAGLLLDWAETLKLGDTEQFSKEELAKYTTEDAPNDIHPKYYDEIVEARLRAFFEAEEREDGAWDAAVLQKHLDALLPSHPQYARLQAVRQHYREIVQNGGWSELKPDNLHVGGRAPLVSALKKRLAVEGYYAGNGDDLYDDALKQAIQSYQIHHQLDITDQVDKTFWKSLNIRAEQRLAEIEANIRRWHYTRYVARDRYIYINIPSFTVELWNEGKRVDTHKVIVGNSTKICNAKTREWELMNATHLLHSRMTYIVFNPYWNVPPRIEVDEYGKKMAEDPKWLENSDFEYYTPKGGGRVLRQKPGPNNALGKVKLIFPNRYNIYLHDTPKQPMFEYTVRAFSHGCMRVQDAMGFAKSVLTVDGQWDEAKINRYFIEKGEHAVDLLTPIDVFIEYHTVTVDDDGMPYFLADVYRIIKNTLNPPTPQERACDPAVDRVSSFRSGGVTADTGP